MTFFIPISLWTINVFYKKPFIGSNNRLIQHQEINKVAKINYAASVLFVTVSVLVYLWLK